MKLYELPDGEQAVRILPQTGDPALYPGEPRGVEEGDVVIFHSIAGRRALCVTPEGEPVELIAWCDVEVIDPLETGR